MNFKIIKLRVTYTLRYCLVFISWLFFSLTPVSVPIENGYLFMALVLLVNKLKIYFFSLECSFSLVVYHLACGNKKGERKKPFSFLGLLSTQLMYGTGTVQKLKYSSLRFYRYYSICLQTSFEQLVLN